MIRKMRMKMTRRKSPSPVRKKTSLKTKKVKRIMLIKAEMKRKRIIRMINMTKVRKK